MGASVTIERNFPRLDTLELTTAAEMREIGLLMRERIIRRTRQGLDAQNQPFTPYSAGYAVQKRRQLGAARVDLTVSGNMLNQIQITEVTENSVTLGWNQ